MNRMELGRVDTSPSGAFNFYPGITFVKEKVDCCGDTHMFWYEFLEYC